MNKDLENVRLQLLTNRNTSFRYDQCNVILKDGEAFYDKVSGNLFIGDGSTAVKNLIPVGLNLLSHIGQQYTADHSTSGTVHIFNINQTVDSNITLIPIISRYTANFNSGDSIKLVMNGIELTISAVNVKMTNGAQAVTKAFCAGTVGQFFIDRTTATITVFIPSATAVWAD